MGQAAGGGAVHDLPASALADSLPNLRGVQEFQRRDQSLHLRAAVVSNWRRRLEQLSRAPSRHREASLCLLQSLHPLRRCGAPINFILLLRSLLFWKTLECLLADVCVVKTPAAMGLSSEKCLRAAYGA